VSYTERVRSLAPEQLSMLRFCIWVPERSRSDPRVSERGSSGTLAAHGNRAKPRDENLCGRLSLRRSESRQHFLGEILAIAPSEDYPQPLVPEPSPRRGHLGKIGSRGCRSI
jgi:hypothetical protein